MYKHRQPPEREPHLRFLVQPLVFMLWLVAKTVYQINQTVMPLHNKLWYWMKGWK